MSEPRIIRRAEVERRTGVAKATLYRMMAAGKVPAPGPAERALRWLAPG